MKNRVLIAIIILFILQIVLLVFIFRPAGTPIDTQRTPIPILPRATLPAASSSHPQSGVSECQAAALQIGHEVEAATAENKTSRVETRGEEYQASFVRDVQPLFKSCDIW